MLKEHPVLFWATSTEHGKPQIRNTWHICSKLPLASLCCVISPFPTCKHCAMREEVSKTKEEERQKVCQEEFKKRTSFSLLPCFCQPWKGLQGERNSAASTVLPLSHQTSKLSNFSDRCVPDLPYLLQKCIRKCQLQDKHAWKPALSHTQVFLLIHSIRKVQLQGPWSRAHHSCQG